MILNIIYKKINYTDHSKSDNVISRVQKYSSMESISARGQDASNSNSASRSLVPMCISTVCCMGCSNSWKNRTKEAERRKGSSRLQLHDKSWLTIDLCDSMERTRCSSSPFKPPNVTDSRDSFCPSSANNAVAL